MRTCFACIGTLAAIALSGMTHAQQVLRICGVENAIMSGRPERLPAKYGTRPLDGSSHPDEAAFETLTEAKLEGVVELNSITLQPVSLGDFCSRP